MSSRAKVLSAFKALHRTRADVFLGDKYALKYVRDTINQEFRKHKTVTNPKEIENLINIAVESNVLLKNHVTQFKEVRPNVWEIRTEHLQQKCMGNVRETCANCTCR